MGLDLQKIQWFWGIIDNTGKGVRREAARTCIVNCSGRRRHSSTGA